MLLKAFLNQYGGLGVGDEFLAHFRHPFLIQEGRLDDLENSGDGSASDATRQVFFLEDNGKPLVVSRSAAKGDIHILDRQVSGRHAEFRPPKGGGPWTLIDLSSTNGTFINGQQVQAGEVVPLKDEAVIGFGPLSSFVFLQPPTFLALLRQLTKKTRESRPPGPAGKAGARATMRMKAMDLAEMQREQPPTMPPKPPPKGRALFLEREPFPPVPLRTGAKLTFGRSDVHADIVLPHPLVSRKHAELEVRADGAYLRDLRSSNGTRVQGVPVGVDPVRLNVGDAIRIADFKLVLRAERPADDDAPDMGQTMVAAPRKPKKLIKGNFAKMPLSDLLAGVEEKSKSGLITIRGTSVGGKIAFQAGRPIWAKTDLFEGEEAIKALLKVERDATFELDPSPQSGARQIERSFSDLLLEEFLG